MKIEITEEMLEEARKRKLESEKAASMAPDDGSDDPNICVSCQ